MTPADGSFAANLRQLLETVVEHRSEWDALDSGAGDGDFGTTLARGAGEALGSWDALAALGPADLLQALSRTMSGVGGSSGPLVAAALSRAASVAESGGTLDPRDAVAMLDSAVTAIRELGGAAVGDKTMIDALSPGADAGRSALTAGSASASEVARAVADAAIAGALGTAELTARRGRAARARSQAAGQIDPGAAAVAVLAARLCEAVGGGAPDVSGLRPVGGGGGSSESSDGAAADGQVASSVGKAFLDTPESFTGQALAGLAAAHPDLVAWDPERRIVFRPEGCADGQVGLVSGGGSGHEPLHVGFVGRGMLTSAAPGGIFASPSADAIHAAMLAADRGAGVLAIVKNYTGDVLNFGQAADRARDAGVEVVSVLVDDDVAVDGSEGRRGTGATLFAEKIAGAAADRGAALAEAAELARRVVSRSASFGVGLAPCAPPGGSALFSLGPDEIEMGVGIHGERGRSRDPLRPASELLHEVAATLIEALAPAGASRALVLVSGLGATPLAEQYLVFGLVQRELDAAGIEVTRRLVGPYVTALNMAGVLVSVLALDYELQSLWDHPVHTPALRW